MLFGMLILIIIPLTGILAFGGNMLLSNNLQYYNNNFKNEIPWIYYIISFYMFLNIAAFPVLTITSRNNLMKCFTPSKIPQNSWDITRYTVAFTLLFIAPIITLSILTKNITKVIDIVGGIFGVFIMVIIPSLTVLRARYIARR